MGVACIGPTNYSLLTSELGCIFSKFPPSDTGSHFPPWAKPPSANNPLLYYLFS